MNGNGWIVIAVLVAALVAGLLLALRNYRRQP